MTFALINICFCQFVSNLNWSWCLVFMFKSLKVRLMSRGDEAYLTLVVRVLEMLTYSRRFRHIYYILSRYEQIHESIINGKSVFTTRKNCISNNFPFLLQLQVSLCLFVHSVKFLCSLLLIHLTCYMRKKKTLTT